jgi:hypothetical protein
MMTQGFVALKREEGTCTNMIWNHHIIRHYKTKAIVQSLRLENESL